LGHLKTITNAEGKATNFTYQVDTGKICLLAAPEGSLMWIYADATGTITGIDHYTDPEGDWGFAYPDVFESGAKVKDVAVVTNPRSYETTYTFDNVANTLTVTDPVGATPDPSTEETDFPNDEAVEAIENVVNRLVMQYCPGNYFEEWDVDGLLDAVCALLPEGPEYYPADMPTDRTERFIAAEFVREKVFELTDQEIPYSVAVTVGAPIRPAGSDWSAAIRLRDAARMEILQHCGEPDAGGVTVE